MYLRRQPTTEKENNIINIFKSQMRIELLCQYSVFELIWFISLCIKGCDMHLFINNILKHLLFILSQCSYTVLHKQYSVLERFM
jgi:hypothetical protein